MIPSGARVLVVGAGIVGCAVAYFLARRGCQVVVLDEHGVAESATSRASLGVLSHPNGGDNPYAQLYRDGHALHSVLAAELAEETGLDVGWRPLGGVELCADEQEREEIYQFNRSRGCAVERLDERALQAREPALVGGDRGLFFPDDHRVDPPKLGVALWAGAQKRGAVAHSGERVARLAQDAGGVEVATRREVYRGDFAVLAAGAWTGPLAAMLGADVAVRPVRGQHVRLGGSPLRHLVRARGRYMVSDGDTTIAGSTVEEVGYALDTTTEAAADLRAWIGRLLGRDLPLVEQRAGLRPKPRGGRPLIGPLAATPRFFVASGHYKNGVLLGPISGKIIARWIVEGAPGRDMDRFEPER